MYREVGVIIRAFSGIGAQAEDERKGGQLASYPGVPAVPGTMPLKGATKWGAKPRRRVAKGRAWGGCSQECAAGGAPDPTIARDGGAAQSGLPPQPGRPCAGAEAGGTGAAGEQASRRAGGRRGRAGRGTRRCAAASPPPVGALSGRWLRRREVGTRRRCSSAAAGTARELRSMARRAAAPGAARESPAARAAAPHF